MTTSPRSTLRTDAAACSGESSSSAELRLTPDEAERFADHFKALANPVRLQITELLSRHSGQVCVCEIEKHFALTQPTISHHLKVLREAGLLDAEQRGLWVYYRLRPGVLTPLFELLRDINLSNERIKNIMEKSQVLFLCSGNSARSQMAEALLRNYAGDRFEVHSAGLEPKGIHPLTVKVMEEMGIDISEQRSKSLKEYLAKIPFRHVITVCSHADQNCPTIWLGTGIKQHWDFEDPAAFEGTEEQKVQKFREIREQIDGRIKTWLAEMEA